MWYEVTPTGALLTMRTLHSSSLLSFSLSFAAWTLGCSGDGTSDPLFTGGSGTSTGGSTTGTGGSGTGSGASPGSGGETPGSGGVGASGGAGAAPASGGDGMGAMGGDGGDDACIDEPVPGDSYTCAEQAGWGKCDEPWMEGYCDLSCGRCGDLVGAQCGEQGQLADLNGEPGTIPPVDCTGAPSDECAFNGGLAFACKERFALGINYAWRDFGTDFGGLEAWSLGGVSGNVDAYNQDISNMKANGADVIRWWMFPDLRGDGIETDAGGTPTGLSTATVADIEKALELAQYHDVYLVLTIFSFDAFRPTRMEGDVEVPGISALVASDAGRAALIDHVVTPIAQAVAGSPYASRLLGWDVINEPEWAILATGSAPAGNEFTPNPELDAVPLEDMKAFIDAALTVLGTETPSALRSVGWAAAKWAWAFEDLTNVEFNQPHIYAWVNDYWPYTTPPDELGYPDKPVVMGEFYLLDGPFDADTPSFQTVMTTWYDAGYAGAWPWQYFDGCISKPGTEGLDLTMIGDFAAAQGCSVRF